jgi:hypothetical protein
VPRVYGSASKLLFVNAMLSTLIHTQLCDAIRTRHLIRFVYDGYERVVAPHIYGEATTQHMLLKGWLMAGWSQSDPHQGWRTYQSEHMQDLHVLAESFTPRRDFNPDDRIFTRTWCRVERRASD